jgi:alkylated DNA repair dioxygenase AlkB
MSEFGLYSDKSAAAWYGDSDYLYTYSNTTKQALLWTKELSDLKQIVEELARAKFNSCLLNLYHNGNEGMGWHSDDEKSALLTSLFYCTSKAESVLIILCIYIAIF